MANAELRAYQAGDRAAVVARRERIARWRAELPRGPNGDPLLGEPLRAALVSLLCEGVALDNAARALAVRWSALTEWLRQGDADVDAGRGETPCAELARDVYQAVGVWRADLEARASEGDRAAVEVLERRDPEHWAPALPQPVERAAGYENLSLEKLEEELARVTARLLARAKPPPELVAHVAAPESGHTPDGLCPKPAQPGVEKQDERGPVPSSAAPAAAPGRGGGTRGAKERK